MARIITVTRTDGTTTDISPNAYAQVAAKRRYGVEAMREDPEAGLFAVFVQDVGPRAAADPEAFDEWLMDVAEFAIREDEPADPPTATASTSQEPSPE